MLESIQKLAEFVALLKPLLDTRTHRVESLVSELTDGVACGSLGVLERSLEPLNLTRPEDHRHKGVSKDDADDNADQEERTQSSDKSNESFTPHFSPRDLATLHPTRHRRI